MRFYSDVDIENGIRDNINSIIINSNNKQTFY